MVTITPLKVGLVNHLFWATNDSLSKCPLLSFTHSLGRGILRTLARASFWGRTWPPPRCSRCTQCRRRCAAAPLHHKFVSMRTKVPSATWGRARLRRDGCPLASGPGRTAQSGTRRRPGSPHSSWTIPSHSSWSTGTTLPAPTGAGPADGACAVRGRRPAALRLPCG